MKTLYQIFFEKQPKSLYDVLPHNKSRLITFLNPSYIEQLPNKSELYEQFDYICSDGMFPIKLQMLFGKNSSERISFDMSSLAGKVFEYASSHNLSTYFIGSDNDSIVKFINQISKAYPDLIVAGYHHGYIKSEMETTALKILSTRPDIVVVGMGAPLQDEFLLLLKQMGFAGTGYTCGGFIHQTTERLNYYPRWIKKFGLRTPYRLIHEPYNWFRVKYYFKFLWKYSYFLMKINK